MNVLTQSSVLTRLLTDNEISLDHLQTFDLITKLLPHHPYHPILWLNRARLLMKMGYSDQANVDATRACKLFSDGSREMKQALYSYYFTTSSHEENLHKRQMLICESYYTFAQTLTAVPAKCYDFLFALSKLNIVRDFNFFNDGPFHEKARQLEERIKNDYRQVLERQKQRKECSIKYQYSEHSFAEVKEIPHFDQSMKAIHRPGMCNGRYPWDKTNERNLAAQTKEGMQVITKKYNKAIENLKASKVEVRLLPHSGQSTTSDENGERLKITNMQFGVFSKCRIGANQVVLQDRTYLTVDNRLYSSLCEHCGETCSSPAQAYKCPRCKTVVFCSKKCREDADSMYHKFLCGRDRQLRPIYDYVQRGVTGPALLPLCIIKLFATSIQASIPVLELPSIKSLHSWTPGLENGNYFLMPNHIDTYNLIVEALDIKPERWVEFDYWIYETLCRIILSNSFGLQGPEKKPRVDCLLIHETISWINHSCNPNCTGSSPLEGEIITCRPVQAGEELTISYTDTNAPKSERQLSLYTSFGFVCACSRCKAEDGGLDPSLFS